MADKDILEQMQDKFELLQTLYDEQLEEDLSRIDIRDRVLSDCIKDQIELQLTWEDISKEVGFLVSELSDECDRIFSIAFKELSMDSQKALSFNEAKLYAQSDNDYVDTKRVLNRAKTLNAKCEAIIDSIKSRKYLLKNICDMLRDGNESYII